MRSSLHSLHFLYSVVAIEPYGLIAFDGQTIAPYGADGNGKWMREMTETADLRGMRLVAPAIKCQHGAMPSHARQRMFRTDESRGKVWDDALSEAGMKQQAAMDTVIDALGLGLASLSELRAAVIKARRAAEE